MFLFVVLMLVLNTLKAPAVGLLTLNNLRKTKTIFSTPKRYDKHPPSLLYGSSLTWIWET